MANVLEDSLPLGPGIDANLVNTPVGGDEQDQDAFPARTGSSTDEAISVIDARIATLQRRIDSMRKQRNALTRFCALPPELLVHVISYLQRKPRGDSDPPDSEYDGRWTRMAHVCSSIRTTVLGARSLWALVDCKANTAWVDLCLERAGNTPLDLLARSHNVGYGNPILEMNHRFIKHFHACHAAELSISSDAIANSSNLLAVLRRSAPFLELLEIHGYRRFSLASQFLGGSCDTLQSLTIRGLSGIDGPPAFPKLRNLELGTDWIHELAHLDTLLDFVTHANELRTLRLERSHVGAHTASLAIDERHLPSCDPLLLLRLRTLELIDLSVYVHFLLRVLPDPSHHFEVRVLRDAQDVSFWSPPSNTHFGYILTRLSAYWKARTDEAELPGGTVVTSEADRSTGVCSHRLEFHSFPDATVSLSYSCWCRIIQSDPLLDQVTELQMWGDRCGPGYGPGDESGAVFLSALDSVVVGIPTTQRQLQAVEKWLKQHVQAHGALTEVRIWWPAKKLQVNGKVADFIRRLQKAGVAKKVHAQFREDSDD
jgi:hypothetical protein